MTRLHTALRVTALAATLLACPACIPVATAASTAISKQAVRQMDRLADSFYVARARFDPLLYATANGDSRYDDQIGMAISPSVRARQFVLYHKLRRQLKELKRAGFSEKDQLNYDLLVFEIDRALDLEPFPEHLLPLDQMDNVPSTLANYASGTGSQPLATPRQYRAYLRRLNQLPAWIEQAIVNMREGIRTGVVQPKAITVAMLPQFKQLRSATPEASIFYTPIKNLPAQFSTNDKRELTAAYRHAIEKIDPALDRLCKFLETDYLAASRSSSGWSALPDGARWYQARIRNNTTLDLPPEQIHQLGLAEVARIQREVVQLGPKLGYDGPPNRLAHWMRAQGKFRPFKTDAEVLEAYRDIYAKVDAKLPEYFSLLPKARLEVQLEPELTRASASEHYTPVAADGSHPGVFWAVVTDPRQYSTQSMVSMLLHEGVPGHHLHAALLKELPLPDFRKFNTEHPTAAAYTEGWALYSETLGKQFGLYEQPEAYFGFLNIELLRAVRLVVDTGIHSQGWSREKAINYMREVLGASEAGAANQIERYMALPAQALSYKLGALKILELRARAQQALGAKFSYREFHQVVLGAGTLPLPILEKQVDRWISRTGR
jgi:uncharacterized protein (DUF885 family)